MAKEGWRHIYSELGMKHFTSLFGCEGQVIFQRSLLLSTPIDDYWEFSSHYPTLLLLDSTPLLFFLAARAKHASREQSKIYHVWFDSIAFVCKF